MKSNHIHDRPSAEYLRECFEYRDGALYWRERPVSHFQRPSDHVTFVKKHAGKPAGKLDNAGYVRIGLRINGRAICMAGHRIVWAIHHGAWPELVIDHIDRNRSNNRIENLRDVTPIENVKNSARNRVYPYIAPYHHGRFAAQVRIGDRGVHIGIFDTAEEADAHRRMVNAELEKLALSLAKETPRPATHRKRHQTFSPSPTDGSEKEADQP